MTKCACTKYDAVLPILDFESRIKHNKDICVVVEQPRDNNERLPYSELLKQLSDYYDSEPIGLHPPADKVCIEPFFEPEQSKGGIWIPEQAKSRCNQGIVKALGPQCSGDVRVGDYVLFSGYDGDIIRYKDQLTIIMPESSLQVRIVPDESDFANRLAKAFEGFRPVLRVKSND